MQMSDDVEPNAIAGHPERICENGDASTVVVATAHRSPATREPLPCMKKPEQADLTGLLGGPHGVFTF